MNETTASVFDPRRAWLYELLALPGFSPEQERTVRQLAAELGVPLRWQKLDLRNYDAGWQEVELVQD